jgi:hypothetical protein
MRSRQCIPFVVAVSFALSACGESSEESYDRGYQDGFDDGIAAVCFEIRKFSDRIEGALKEERIC